MNNVFRWALPSVFHRGRSRGQRGQGVCLEIIKHWEVELRLGFRSADSVMPQKRPCFFPRGMMNAAPLFSQLKASRWGAVCIFEIFAAFYIFILNSCFSFFSRASCSSPFPLLTSHFSYGGFSFKSVITFISLKQLYRLLLYYKI